MVEVLFLFGLIGWSLLMIGRWLSALPVFPALVFSAVLLPLWTAQRYRRLSIDLRLSELLRRREPLPPERFYWSVCQSCLRFQAYAWAVPAIAAWYNAASLPAAWSVNPSSLAGWLNALVGTMCGSRSCAAFFLLWRASQRFDPMQPGFIGLARVAMYRLSDNYEYLGQKIEAPEKEKVY